MQNGEFRMLAKTLFGLEEVLADELSAIGAKNIEIGNRVVSFEGDKRMLYEANFKLRTALRILKPIHSFNASDPDELYTKLLKFNWEEYLNVDQSFSIDTVVYSDTFTHSKYASYKAKDAIVDYFRNKTGKRPSVRIDNPNVIFNIHITHTSVTLSLDSSGDSLHKRGYREVQTAAPINEVLAAAILMMAGWKGETDFIDPMCGSGTFLIEAALIARNIAPGVYRSSYAFQKWKDYDADLFDEIYNDESGEREFKHKIYGSDISAIAVEVAKRNVARAGLSSNITIEKMSFKNRPKPENKVLIVTNPPYGERLKLKESEDLYAMIGERLKHNYSGSNAWIIAYKAEHFDSVGLKASSKYSLMNGSLACELRSYELFDGKRNDFKTKKDDKDKPYKREKREYKEMDRKAYKSNNRFAKDDKKKKEFSKSKDDRKESKIKGLWPNDRFRDRENKQHYNRRLQVYKEDSASTDKED